MLQQVSHLIQLPPKVLNFAFNTFDSSSAVRIWSGLSAKVPLAVALEPLTLKRDLLESQRKHIASPIFRIYFLVSIGVVDVCISILLALPSTRSLSVASDLIER
jgi:hypothetical protein